MLETLACLKIFIHMKMDYRPGLAGGGQHHSVGFLDLSSSLTKGTSVMSLLFQSPRKEKHQIFGYLRAHAEMRVAFIQRPGLHQ